MAVVINRAPEDHAFKGLGRRPLPEDDPKVHLRKYIAGEVLTIPANVEDVLPLPYAYRPRYDQGEEGACVGFAWSWAMSIRNRRFYDAFWLYRAARRVDEWEGEDYEGTSVRAGGDILRSVGHLQIHDPRHRHRPDVQDGIERFRWAQSVDEIRASIAAGLPVVLGIEWLTSFSFPDLHANKELWIGEGNLGRVVGGHAICCYGASDRRQAVKLVNSWGRDYGLVWLPYATLEMLLRGIEFPGEAAIITDR